VFIHPAWQSLQQGHNEMRKEKQGTMVAAGQAMQALGSFINVFLV